MSLVRPDISDLITEDDEPVDNLFSAKQQRLLVEPLYSTWGQQRSDFLADANIGLYASVKTQPLVPDALLSLDVVVPDGWWEAEERCYCVWNYGKPPDVVVEIVSNRRGGEDERKRHEYGRMGVPYYAIFDPQHLLSRKTLRLLELSPRSGYRNVPPGHIARVGLGLVLWTGSFEKKHETWLRWCDLDGNLIQTGYERAEAERQRADAETQRAEAEKQRADRLAERLRAAGLDAD